MLNSKNQTLTRTNNQDTHTHTSTSTNVTARSEMTSDSSFSSSHPTFYIYQICVRAYCSKIFYVICVRVYVSVCICIHNRQTRRCRSHSLCSIQRGLTLNFLGGWVFIVAFSRFSLAFLVSHESNVTLPYLHVHHQHVVLYALRTDIISTSTGCSRKTEYKLIVFRACRRESFVGVNVQKAQLENEVLLR